MPDARDRITELNEMAGVAPRIAKGISMSASHLTQSGPPFFPEKYFDGKFKAWGIITSTLGTLLKRCTIDAEGKFDITKNTIALTEAYSFDDGHTDIIRWSISKLADGRYEGDEPRLRGKATGERAGFAYHWKYSRDTPQSDGTSKKLNFDDWFYLITDRVCIVRGSVGRFGLPFAFAHVTYQKIGDNCTSSAMNG